MRRLLAAAVGLLVASSASSALANGRFPESNALFFSAVHPELVLLRTTFGLITSHDRGTTWDWVCEQSVGLAMVEDPMYAITPDGTVIASTFLGLAVSHDGLCNWGFVGGPLKDLIFADLTARPSTPESVIAFSTSYDGQDDDAGTTFFKSILFETKDQGKTFAALPASFDSSLLGETVDISPSDPDRIYVSATRTPGAKGTAHLLTSRDHGKTFAETAIPLIKPEVAALIAAIDPQNPDRLYLRTTNDPAKPARLLVTDDAGMTFRTVYTSSGPLPGFALSPDGTKVWIGGPLDGLHVASTTDFAFQEKSKVEIGCLSLAKDGLWACSSEKSGFVVALSTDEGATFQPKLHFCDIRGPMSCPEGSTQHTECVLGGTSSDRAPRWPTQRALLGCEALDGGSGDGGDAGTGSGNTDSFDGGGCSIRAFSPTPLVALAAGLVAATATALRRRRRRR